jgi:hypothetical protein
MPALSLLLCLAGSAAASEGVPKDVAAYLRNVAAFAPDRLAALESGEAIAKIRRTRTARSPSSGRCVSGRPRTK